MLPLVAADERSIAMLCRSRPARKPPCNAKQSPEQAISLTFTLDPKLAPWLVDRRSRISRAMALGAKNSQATLTLPAASTATCEPCTNKPGTELGLQSELK